MAATSTSEEHFAHNNMDLVTTRDGDAHLPGDNSSADGGAHADIPLLCHGRDLTAIPKSMATFVT